MQTIAERLVQEREHIALSREAVCNDIDVSPWTLRSYESGRSVPGGVALRELCYVYSCTADFLLGIPPLRQRADRRFRGWRAAL